MSSAPPPADDACRAARQVAERVLAPGAQATDRATRVPEANLRALADAGLFGLVGPRSHGGLDAPPPVAREVFETLAGACGATFFLWAQHHGPVRQLAASANAALRARHLRALCAGTLIAGTAFAYLRRPGPAAVAAVDAGDGYRLDGEAPWVTSWGVAGVLLVAARLPDGRVLSALVPADAGGLTASAPLELAAMQAAGTVRLGLRDVLVPADQVVDVVDPRRWQERDRRATAQPNAAVFGLTRTAVRLLAGTAARSGDDLAEELAGALAAELERCRVRSYALADAGGDGDAELARLTEARAWSLELAVRAAQALVVARGGRAMGAGDPAQRLLREAAFYLIQAQTGAGRAATLRRLLAAADGGRPA